MRIAVIGTRGIPARYGGFETAVEEIGRRLAEQGHCVEVYSRRTDQSPSRYLGMRVIPVRSLPFKVSETLSRTALSVARICLAGTKPDAVLVFNAANSPLLLPLRWRGIPAAIHLDGLEWQRGKWSGFGQRYFKWAEALAIRLGNEIIADAGGIADYVSERYGRSVPVIVYGTKAVSADPTALVPLGLTPRGYHLIVARFEPENHVLELIQGFLMSASRLPLVLVGSAAYAGKYSIEIESALVDAKNQVLSLGAVWDQGLLDQLYANCASYLHGHAVGGTNPSLLRAVGAGAPVTCWDVSFNREVVRGCGLFVNDPLSTARAIELSESRLDSRIQEAADAIPEFMGRYNWDAVAAQYAALCKKLMLGTSH